jgi:Zn-finger nucleic acid-binding protein
MKSLKPLELFCVCCREKLRIVDFKDDQVEISIKYKKKCMGVVLNKKEIKKIIKFLQKI